MSKTVSKICYLILGFVSYFEFQICGFAALGVVGLIFDSYLDRFDAMLIGAEM